MATIARNFDHVNYVTKTKTIVMSAGSSYTLGDAYNGGTAIDLFVSADFSVAVGGTAKTKDIDFTLTGIDSDYTEDYGTTFFTVIKSLTITATVTITYRCHGTYTDAGIINAHETRLDGHDTDIDSLTDTLASHSERMTNIESVNTSQTEDITEAQTDIIGLRSDVDTHIANTTDAHGATSAATASKMMIRDANARVQIAAGAADLDAVNKAQMDAAISSAVIAAGEGDVAGPSSSVAGRIATFADATGKIIEDSGYGIGNATDNVPLNNGTLNNNLNADMLDGYHAGNASGNVPLNNNVENAGLKAQSSRLLFNRSTSASESILDMVVTDFTAYGNGAYYYHISGADAAAPWAGTVGRAYSLGDATNCKLLAYLYNSKASAVRNRVNGVWDAAWTYILNGSGYATKALALDDAQSSRTIKVKSGSFTATASSTVTFASAFSSGLLFAFAVYEGTQNVIAAATSTKSTLYFTGLTAGQTYNWIAWGF